LARPALARSQFVKFDNQTLSARIVSKCRIELPLAVESPRVHHTPIWTNSQGKGDGLDVLALCLIELCANEHCAAGLEPAHPDYMSITESNSALRLD